MFKKIISFTLSLVMLVSALSVSFLASASEYTDYLVGKGFPQDYADKLSVLHDKYPNWEFEPFATGISWSAAVNGERTPHNKQLIQKQASLSADYYCNCADCMKNGNYVIQEAGNMVSASQMAVEYYMDPRNWLDEKHIFQFEPAIYDATQTQVGIEAIIASTWMSNANITYTSTYGDVRTCTDANGNPITYSQAILLAAQNSGVSAYYLASKIVQEVGGKNPTASGVVGNKSPFVGIYNYYNIGAYSTGTQGLEWASGFLKAKTATALYSLDNSGSSIPVAKDQTMTYVDTVGEYYRVRLYTQSGNTYTAGAEGYVPISALRTTYFNYGRPWTDPFKAIYYGATYIANSFLKYQNTGYLQKFNVNSASGSLYNHEYMKNAEAASKEAVSTYNSYVNAGVIANRKVFYIPVFSDMTEAVNLNNSVQGLTLSKRAKTSLTLAWNLFPNASKYYVYVKNVTAGSKFNKTVTTNSATLSGLTAGSEYSVKVKAYVNGAWTDYCEPVVVHTTPSKATKLKVNKKSSNSVTLSWKKISGVTGYKIYSYTSSTGKYTLLKTVYGDNSSNILVDNLTPGQKYSFAVCGFVVDVAEKNGVKSDTVSTATKPNKPVVNKSVSKSREKIKTAWQPLEGSATGFQVEYAKDKKFKKKVATKTFAGKAKTSYTGKGFTKGKTYYIRVRAYTSLGKTRVYSSWSKTTKIKCK